MACCGSFSKSCLLALCLGLAYLSFGREESQLVGGVQAVEQENAALQALGLIDPEEQEGVENVGEEVPVEEEPDQTDEIVQSFHTRSPNSRLSKTKKASGVGNVLLYSMEVVAAVAFITVLVGLFKEKDPLYVYKRVMTAIMGEKAVEIPIVEKGEEVIEEITQQVEVIPEARGIMSRKKLVYGSAAAFVVLGVLIAVYGMPSSSMFSSWTSAVGGALGGGKDGKDETEVMTTVTTSEPVTFTTAASAIKTH